MDPCLILDGLNTLLLPLCCSPFFLCLLLSSELKNFSIHVVVGFESLWAGRIELKLSPWSGIRFSPASFPYAAPSLTAEYSKHRSR